MLAVGVNLERNNVTTQRLIWPLTPPGELVLDWVYGQYIVDMLEYIGR